MSRQQPGLRPPTEGIASEVPATSRRGVTLHRVVDRRYGQPWHFSTRDTATGQGGRFDLTAPAGTCYLAATVEAALLERLADPTAAGPPYASLRTLRNLTLWSGEVCSAHELADTTVTSVPGLTLELSTITPYDLTWAWGDALYTAGRRGLIYQTRFGMAEGIALFDHRGGAPDGTLDGRYRAELVPTPAIEMLDELPPALRELGTHVLADDFRPAPDP